MTRNLTATAAIALFLWTATPPVQAQYFTGYNRGYYSGFNTGGGGFRPGLYYNNPYTGQSFGYNFTSRIALGANYVNPITGQRNSFYYNRTISGPFLPGRPLAAGYNNALAAQVSAYSLGGGYLTGGVGALGMGGNNPAVNPVVQEQVRLLKAAGGRANDNDVEARKMIADQWAYEQRAKSGKVRVTAEGEAFRDTPDEDVVSGRGINALAQAIRELDGGTSGKAAPLLPAGLLSRIAFAPSPATDVVEMAAAGRIDFPDALNGQEWLALRSDLEKAAAPVLEAAAAGKPVASAAAEKLAAQVKTSRQEAAPLIRGVSFTDATRLSRFFNRLENFAQLGQQSDLKGAYVPEWATVGASAKEFADHLGQYNLTVAPARPGDQEAYFSLHRAMSDYYNALAAK